MSKNLNTMQHWPALFVDVVCGSISSYGNLHTTVLVFAGQTQSFSWYPEATLNVHHNKMISWATPVWICLQFFVHEQASTSFEAFLDPKVLALMDACLQVHHAVDTQHHLELSIQINWAQHSNCQENSEGNWAGDFYSNMIWWLGRKKATIEVKFIHVVCPFIRLISL